MAADAQSTIAGRELLGIVLSLEAEEAAIRDHNKVKSDIIKDAGNKGWDRKTIRKVMAARRLDPEVRTEQDGLFDMYMHAVEVAEKEVAHARVENAGKFGAAKPVIENQEQPEEPASEINNGEDHDGDSEQRVGRPDSEQRGSAPVQGSVGCGENADDGDQGQGAGASRIDRCDGPVSGTVDRQDQDGRSCHVGGEVDHEIAESDGGAFVAVKGSARLANVQDVEPSPSDDHSSEPNSPVETKAETASSSPVSATNFTPPAFILKDRKPLREHCLNPSCCASGTRDHCHACKKAMAESEAA